MSATAWVRSTLGRFFGQLRRDLGERRTALPWVAIGLWSVVVSALHFGGLEYGIYTAIPWWDLMTHAMSGLGVAAILYLGFCRPVRAVATPWWLLPALLAIGAGFEVYEYLFKSFWWEWTLRYYAIDTAVDLVLDTAGALVVVLGHLAFRLWTDAPMDAGTERGQAGRSRGRAQAAESDIDPEPASDGGVSER